MDGPVTWKFVPEASGPHQHGPPYLPFAVEAGTITIECGDGDCLNAIKVAYGAMAEIIAGWKWESFRAVADHGYLEWRYFHPLGSDDGQREQSRQETARQLKLLNLPQRPFDGIDDERFNGPLPPVDERTLRAIDTAASLLNARHEQLKREAVASPLECKAPSAKIVLLPSEHPLDNPPRRSAGHPRAAVEASCASGGGESKCGAADERRNTRFS